MKKTYYIGLDVHKETIAIAYTFSGSRSDATYHGGCGGSNPAAETALRKLAKKLKVKFKELKVCYEAGPTGFVLARRLRHLGLECAVMSPSMTLRKPNERVKTDKKDAQNIAKLYRNGDITEVRVPPALDEAVRDVCRARTDASDDLSRAKQRLNAFLLRNGYRYSGKSRWTPSHMRYLRDLSLPNLAQKIVLEEYMQAIDSCIDRVQRLKEKMKELLLDWEWEPIVRALMACKGFQEVAAMTIISELGDLRRFDHPCQLMKFLGLVPSEETTGTKRRQGGITKCGNSHARWMLVECSQHYRKAPKISAALTTRQEKQNKKVKALSWRMQNRLNTRYVKLKVRGKRENKIIVAIAREMCAFIWEMQNKLDLPMPEQTTDKSEKHPALSTPGS
ncbi:MAG: IS110 family transposase [Thiomicrorhabdus sp.]|nr:IS110 family transposase [Thiomicrorhabdus sp.]